MGTEYVDAVTKVHDVTFDFKLPGSLKIDIFADAPLNREKVGLARGQIKRNTGVLQRISFRNCNYFVTPCDFDIESVPRGTGIEFTTYVDLIQIRIADKIYKVT